MRETDVDRGGRVVRVRDAGDPGGSVVMYFHGTPGSRLDLGFDEQLAASRGVRLVMFDRPGYGRSTPVPFGLATIAADAHAIADALGVDQFATLGLSGGGPGALAAATVGGGRVRRVGVSSGAAPFQQVPGLLDELDDTDRAALALLPGDPAAAAAGFGAGFEPLIELSRDPDGPGVAAAFGDALSPRDREVRRPGVRGRVRDLDARGAAPGNQRRRLGQRLLDRGLGRRPERGPLPGAALVRHRRPLRADRARTVAGGEPAAGQPGHA